MGTLAQGVEVRVEVPVGPGEALAAFRDPQRWVRFQGSRAELDPRPGGRVVIDLREGVEVAGHYVEIEPDRRVVLTWGRVGDEEMPPGATTVTVTATAREEGGSFLDLRHDGLPSRESAESHLHGWRYHLTRLAVALGTDDPDCERADLFCAAWSDPDPVVREGLMLRTCSEHVVVADPWGQRMGIIDVTSHLATGHLAAPHLRLRRTGPLDRVGPVLRWPYALEGRDDLDDETGDLIGTVSADQRFIAVARFPDD